MSTATMYFAQYILLSLMDQRVVSSRFLSLYCRFELNTTPAMVSTGDRSRLYAPERYEVL